MIQSLDRGLRILELLVKEGSEVPLGEIAQKAELAPATTYRLLQTLLVRGYVKQLPSGKYQHGPRILELAGEVLTSMDLSLHARPALLQLQEWTQETIHFGVLAGEHAQYVDKLEGRRPYRLASVVGMSLDLHSSAIGKCILAFLPSDQRARLLDKPLKAHTERTITDHRALNLELDRIHSLGYCLDDEEDREGVRCIGAPVFNHHGDAIGGISVSGPTFHFSISDAVKLAPHLLAAAREVSLSLGAQDTALPTTFAAEADARD